MTPFEARPSGFILVTLLIASGLQYVRISENICAVFVRRYPNSIDTPFMASFSVATRYGGLMPFQSNEEQRIASRKSPFGMWSVHWRCPWKPERLALCPSASSHNPSFLSLGLPTIRSRAISVIFTTVSHSLSFCFLDFGAALTSFPSLQFFRVHSRAFLNSALSKISSLSLRLNSLISTYSFLIPRYSWKKSSRTIDPAIPIETDPIERYVLHFIIDAASPALTNRRIFSLTSSGMDWSPESCTSCP